MQLSCLPSACMFIKSISSGTDFKSKSAALARWLSWREHVHTPKDCKFDPRSGHIPRLQVWSLVRAFQAHTGGNQSMCFSLSFLFFLSFSPSLSLFLFLSLALSLSPPLLALKSINISLDKNYKKKEHSTKSLRIPRGPILLPTHAGKPLLVPIWYRGSHKFWHTAWGPENSSQHKNSMITFVLFHFYNILNIFPFSNWRFYHSYSSASILAFTY